MPFILQKPKAIVIVGPTASGKSELAVKIAKHLSNPSRIKSNETRIMNSENILAEIISADSRQVYRGLNIGSGKVPKDLLKRGTTRTIRGTTRTIDSSEYLYRGVRHHLLDVASPKKTFTVAQYQKLANKAFKALIKRQKIPIICGGSGFYINALIDGFIFPEVKPDLKLRKKLEKKTTDELFRMLQKMAPKRAKTIDSKNRRRLSRAIEIIKTKGKILPLKTKPLPAKILFIGLKKDAQTLKRRIKKRLFKRLKDGLINEVKKLHQSGLSWKRLENFGLEYRYVAQFLQNKITKEEMMENILKESWHYAKRQMNWFKRNKDIIWLKNPKEALKITQNFLNTD